MLINVPRKRTPYLGLQSRPNLRQEDQKSILEDPCSPAEAQSEACCHRGFSVYSTSLPSSSSKVLRALSPCLLPSCVTCLHGRWGARDPKTQGADGEADGCKVQAWLHQVKHGCTRSLPSLLASKHRAGCQSVYEKEIASHAAALTSTVVYAASMPTCPYPKLTRVHSRPALRQPVMPNVAKT